MKGISKISTTLVFYIVVYIYAQGIINNEKHGNTSTQIKQTYRFDKLPDNGSYLITIENISSNIKISGKEGSGALVTITRIVFGITEEEITMAHKLASSSVKHIEDESLIQIIGENKNDSEYFIETYIYLDIPKNVNLNLQILGGDVDLSDIRGESIIETLGGDILIKNYLGRIDVKTEGGDVNIDYLEGILYAHSFGGNLRIAKCKGEIYLSTIGGDNYVNELSGLLNIQCSGGSINITNIESSEIVCRTSGGAIKGANISGKSNLKSFGNSIELVNISGNVNLETSGGSIKVDSSKGFLKCEAATGDIQLKDVSGVIESLTSSGNITLESVYNSSIMDHSINMVTHSGDLIASIPKELPASIKSIIHQTTSIKNLNSTIALNIKVEQNKVVGTRVIGGGTIPINLEAHHGLIVLKDY